MDLLRIRQKIKMEESRDTDENDGSRISKSLSRLLPLKTKIPEYCEVISEPIEVKNIAPRLQVKASNCFQVASLAVLIVSVLGATKCLAVQPNNDVFTDQFVMQMPGGANLARQTAEKHGFIFLGQIFDDHFHLKHHRIAKRSLQAANESHELTQSLHSEPSVQLLKQQTLKSRAKRDFLRLGSSASRIEPSTAASSSSLVSNSGRRFDDPRWAQMWYLNRGQGLDMNVEMVWDKKITGKGVVVTILDDGLEKNHPDLIANYDPEASYDVNNHDDDPMPRYDMIDSNRHGTRCAGEVAADANNSICAVGVAFGAKVGGVRMLDGDVTDAVEARSLSLNPQHIQVYSASWGPDDDGKTVDGPGELATRAFVDGVNKGRGGLGSIFVWASGNGGREHDNCNCDGYTNSIWTLSISSATENGLVPWYSEACSSTLATTYSSGSFGERQIITTDLHHGCTSSHTGTSASAPLAAGICALALEANPQLTWRDMQHLVVITAHPANLHVRDWKTNGVGRNVSHSFGYGLMDANAMVESARDWVTVPPQKICEVYSHTVDKLIPAKSHVELTLQVSCDNVRFLEHVQAKVSLTATRRGDLHIYLTSPSGTRSTLLAQRPMDNSRSGFQNWPFMTVHTWGENPNGVWKLEIHNEGRYYSRAYLKEWTLVMYGTTSNPDRRKRKYKSPTPAPTISTAKASTVAYVTKSPILNAPGKYGLPPSRVVIDPLRHNNLEEDTLPEMADVDVHGRDMLKAELGHDLSVHGTRADKSEELANGSEDATSGAGCAFSARKGASTECLGCFAGFLLLQGKCVTTCGDGLYALRPAPGSSGGPRGGLCLKCHYSCKSCEGDKKCSSCWPDSQLHRTGRCHARELVEEVVELERWYTCVTIVFLCLCVVILVLVIYIVSEKHPQLFCCWLKSSRRPGAVYDGLPLKRGRQESHLMHLKGTSKRLPISAPSYRDEPSEDDL